MKRIFVQNPIFSLPSTIQNKIFESIAKADQWRNHREMIGNHRKSWMSIDSFDFKSSPNYPQTIPKLSSADGEPMGGDWERMGTTSHDDQGADKDPDQDSDD